MAEVAGAECDIVRPISSLELCNSILVSRTIPPHPGPLPFGWGEGEDFLRSISINMSARWALEIQFKRVVIPRSLKAQRAGMFIDYAHAKIVITFERSEASLRASQIELTNYPRFFTSIATGQILNQIPMQDGLRFFNPAARRVRDRRGCGSGDAGRTRRHAGHC
jgi:hypothetical protein